MREFTKGKWKYMNDGTIRACRPNSILLINILKLAGFEDFKKVLGEEKAREMIDANGRLAAAAPEMYHLLIFCLKEAENGHLMDPEQIKELLARIDGKEKQE